MATTACKPRCCRGVNASYGQVHLPIRIAIATLPVASTHFVADREFLHGRLQSDRNPMFHGVVAVRGYAGLSGCGSDGQDNYRARPSKITSVARRSVWVMFVPAEDVDVVQMPVLHGGNARGTVGNSCSASRFADTQQGRL